MENFGMLANDKPLSHSEVETTIMALVAIIERGGASPGFARVVSAEPEGMEITISLSNRLARRMIQSASDT